MRNHTRPALSIALALILIACGSATATTGANLDGAWTNHTTGRGVAVTFTLRWTADSVTGSGAYHVLDQSLGCGGASLHGDGTVRLTAARADTVLSGWMMFDNGWTPPYRGTLQGDSYINGAFQSIDAGPCPFGLYRGFVP